MTLTVNVGTMNKPRQIVRTSPEIEALIRRTVSETDGDHLNQTQAAVRAVLKVTEMTASDALNVVKMVRAEESWWPIL